MLPICKETAVEYGRLGQLARAKKKAERELKLSVLDTADFQTQELVRVRTQISRLNEAIDKELSVNIPAVEPIGDNPGSPAIGPSGLELDRLTRAMKQLCEKEQKLAGRPDPGSYRPTTPKDKMRGMTFTPAPETV